VTSKRKSSLLPGLFVLRVLALLIGCSGLIWGILNVARGAISDDFQNLEDRLLQFETFSQAAGMRTLASPIAKKELGACDNHAQRALLLLEMPLADAALRSGAVQDFDQHIQSLESRSRQVLACAPRDSLVWLLLFGIQVEHGRLDDHSFDFLETSYETSPNEAWVAVRRMAVALPVVLAAPEPVRQKILAEFQNLVRNGFLDIPAFSYLNARPPVRALLQSRIEELDPLSQKAFFEALPRYRR
jgi:hypothetical protein